MKKLLGLLVVGATLASTATLSAGDRPTWKGPRLFPTFTRVKPTYLKPTYLKPTVQLTQNTLPPPAPAAETSPRLTVPAPMPDAMPGTMPPSVEPIQLYHRVKYEDLDNIHPCAVTKIIAVPNPCIRGCCDQGCVYVKICVPPCGCLRVKRSRSGRNIEYDYGDYEVDIHSRRGVVVVNYDD